jgi:hypothetical protein
VSSPACQGGPVEEVRPGDRVYIDPGENHWHGAPPTRFHTQVAYQEADESDNHTTWGRHLTDEEYPGCVTPASAPPAHPTKGRSSVSTISTIRHIRDISLPASESKHQ